MKVIEKQIRDAIGQADQFAWQIQQEVNRAADDAKNNPENATNIFSRYYTAFQDRIAQGKQKAEQAKNAADNTKANVAMTQQDSIFKNINLPGGISSKATEYKELAQKGDKWESPVFGIGSAAATSSLQKPAPIKRKPHNVTSPQLRDPGQSLGNVGSTSDASNGAASGGSAFDYSSSQGYDNTSFNQNNTNTSNMSYGNNTNKSNGTTLGANNPVMSGFQ